MQQLNCRSYYFVFPAAARLLPRLGYSTFGYPLRYTQDNHRRLLSIVRQRRRPTGRHWLKSIATTHFRESNESITLRSIIVVNVQKQDWVWLNILRKAKLRLFYRFYTSFVAITGTQCVYEMNKTYLNWNELFLVLRRPLRDRNEKSCGLFRNTNGDKTTIGTGKPSAIKRNWDNKCTFYIFYY